MDPRFEGMCHTLEIEDFGCGSNSLYWLSPTGQLFLIDYTGTADSVPTHISWDDKFLNFRWKPNGNKGKVIQSNLTKTITVEPEKWDGDWDDRPAAKMGFTDGLLTHLEIIK